MRPARAPRAALGLALGVAVLTASFPAPARADDLFAEGVAALADERTDEAIARFEALADRGVVDPAVSFDRGVAYARRVREGREEPGDLGRAAHGFEEARILSADAALAADAARGLLAVRGEVARRRAHAGDRDDVDEGTSLAGAVADALPEDAWALVALAGAFAVLVAAALRVGARPEARRRRAASAVVAGFGALALVLGAAFGAEARAERTGTRLAVVVSTQASLADERFVTVPGRRPLAEGAQVRVLEERDTHVRVRLLDAEGWLPRATVRFVASP